MKTGIDPTNDFAFKKIFGQPSHAGLTLSLVNSILPLVGRKPASFLRIQNPFVLSDFAGGKEVILDLRLEDSEGRDIQVEMQVKTGGPLERRMLDNWARVYAEQLPKGDGYEVHRPVISIWILKEELFRDDAWLHLVEARVSPGGGLFSEDFLVVVLGLGDFRRSLVGASQAGIDEGVGKWLSFLCEGEGLDPEGEPDAERKEALMIMEEINMSKEERAIYLSRFDAQAWRISEIHAAQAEGLAKGLEEGRAKGLEEGLAEGRAKGRTEGAKAKAVEDARNLKRLGVSLTVIAEATGLDAELVEGL
ncbi:MAG TPA: Rpn family recombination-promoting nuclease/putative transposase [Rectinemataceae bacterium]|nr:Rpn family recombination-promoting nuclease/putative transposase [Rectinemataceae bacterium]